jgi:hypothetical protein
MGKFALCIFFPSYHEMVTEAIVKLYPLIAIGKPIEEPTLIIHTRLILLEITTRN